FNMPETAEVHDEVVIDITVTTDEGNAVEYGQVYLMVDSIVKNAFEVDVLGTTSVTLPNLVKNSEISVFYLGDKMSYLDSDTITKSIVITPSTSSVIPYPVTFNLTQYPEIDLWTRENVTATTPTRAFSYTFTQDSLPGIKLEIETEKVTYHALVITSADQVKNQYCAGDQITLPLGSGRSNWVSFKTPWLNAGSYNFYFNHRHNTSTTLNITSVTMDEKE